MGVFFIDKPLSRPTVLTGVFCFSPCSTFIRRGEMEKAIGVKDLQHAGLLGAEYTELDLYDAFMMYLIVNDESDNRVILLYGNFILDSKTCFQMDTWLV